MARGSLIHHTRGQIWTWFDIIGYLATYDEVREILISNKTGLFQPKTSHNSKNQQNKYTKVCISERVLPQSGFSSTSSTGTGNERMSSQPVLIVHWCVRSNTYIFLTKHGASIMCKYLSHCLWCITFHMIDCFILVSLFITVMMSLIMNQQH